jgi:serine/threonine protein phosphatase PrpC/predicted nucleic acid-binding Zn ribbon protein
VAYDGLPVKHCPTCGASFGADERFCEADGTTLADDDTAVTQIPPPGVCPACGKGTFEADGFCSACGRRATSRPTPPAVLVGTSLAGGTVVESLAADEHLVRGAGGTTIRVVLGEAGAVERENDVLDRIGGNGPFPTVVECGVDDKLGSFLALAMPPLDAQPLADVGPALVLTTAIAVVRGVVDAAQIVEKLGFAWEPQRDDVHVRPDGSVRLARVRVPRRLAPGERLDARAVVETVGPTFVPTPAIDGPSRAFRLLLPHTPIPGDSGHTIEDVRRELAIIEAELPPPTDDGLRIAGVCDPGLRRPHNEDAMSFATGMTDGERWTVLVVCDGVSSSSHAEQASAIASKTACDALAHFARTGDVALEPGANAVAQAIRAAHVAVCAQIVESAGDDPPGTTIVVGLVWRRRLTVGWIGDSRAYWISDTGAELLTEDHSWANEAIARGEVTEGEAMMSPLAHALTRCLGPLEVADLEGPQDPKRPRIREVQPDVRARDLPGPGWVLLCSDGFWNYFPSAAQVAHVVRAAAAPKTAGRIARKLVNLALARGGQDNTTTLVYEHR